MNILEMAPYGFTKLTGLPWDKVNGQNLLTQLAKSALSKDSNFDGLVAGGLGGVALGMICLAGVEFANRLVITFAELSNEKVERAEIRHPGRLILWTTLGGIAAGGGLDLVSSEF